MGLKKSSPIGSDWRDVAALIVAFEAINQVRIGIRIAGRDRRGSADLYVTVVADAREPAYGEVKCLGSVSSSCYSMNLRNLEDVVMQLLYRLDAQLASGEFARVLKP